MKKNIIIILLITIILQSSYTIKVKDINNYIDSLTLREKIGQLFFVYTPTLIKYKTIPGGIIPSKKIIKGIYNNENIYYNYFDNYNIPLFMGIDGEGGLVNRFNFIEKIPSMLELTKMPSKDIDSILNKQIFLMKKCHINVNFAPVVDISNKNTALMKRTKRIISSNSDTIIAFSKYYIKKYKKNRILCTLKHYPGYGNTNYNSDVDLYNYIGNEKDFLEGFIVFSKLLNKSDFVMISNLIYPFLDSLPAIMSKNIVNYIHYYNKYIIILSDDIASKAYNNSYEVLKKSFNAGCDMFILMDSQIYENLVDSMEYWINNGIIQEEKLDNKLKKIILKKEYLFRIISEKK